MPHGLQVFNADGSLQFDATNRLFRTLAIVDTGTANGYIDLPEEATGTLAPVLVEAGDGSTATPNMSVSGRRVSWDWSGIPADDRASVKLNIEVY